ncbi:hypothetical protein EWM64_g6873 [Hericium alpestre]|uniref:G-protein coupled receptors family 1 profile domain-containing protein n=1 Tax=Hericium alpestre TaxID=135208 RepID=A0A4Y9ZSC7_9AGAM|nr:hypothetical protein EWM64_g6873 [Hericium alpestre]
MSTPLTNASMALPPLPDGLNSIAAIRPSLTLLMIGTVCTSILLPVGVALLLFSTPALRRKPIFIMNVISVCLGITEGLLSGYDEINAILAPNRRIDPSTFTAFTCLSFFGPLFVESILLLRLWAVFPPQQISRVLKIIVYVPPVMLKLARLANGILYIVKWQSDVKSLGNPVQAGQMLWGTQPSVKIEWMLQTVDNLYASSLFIWRLKGKGGVNGAAATSSRKRRSSYASRLKALFWISISNFVFPVILNIAQIILVFRDSNFLDGSYVFIVNNYVAIIGVILATVWAAGIRWVDGPESNTVETMSMPHFAAPTRVDMSDLEI